ncbi:olfactory receptor-like protein DTMT [Erpetoichthys calabaricus]|uniref:olfactory receptor-like protein DTMT n=1 Tax=Erpetoichthys calabaricus TaxID=27687 RepID=UPI00223429A0|nr:olfactory receptor-like protein DTMT [Erpetoichthys calabaricus]
MVNHSTPETEFVLHCVIGPEQRTYTIALLVLIYLVSLIGNLLVILVIQMNHRLHSPMYIFISTLALIDLANSTTLIPKMVADIQFEAAVVPYGACILQMYIVYNLEQMESLLLAFMALDRYVAVVYPLRYNSIITKKNVYIVVIVLPVFAFLVHSPFVVFASELSFCRTNILPYCFCEYATMVQISCNNDPKYLTLLSMVVIVLGLCPLVLIFLSYTRIVVAALKISSSDGKSKVFSTCLTHLLVVCLFYFPLLTSYILPGTGVKLSAETSNTMVIVGNVVPPMLNPVIYSFRNKEIKNSIYKILRGKRMAPEATE